MLHPSQTSLVTAPKSLDIDLWSQELLIHLAEYLEPADLKNFRLADHRTATAGKHIIARRLRNVTTVSTAFALPPGFGSIPAPPGLPLTVDRPYSFSEFFDTRKVTTLVFRSNVMEWCDFAALQFPSLRVLKLSNIWTHWKPFLAFVEQRPLEQLYLDNCVLKTGAWIYLLKRFITKTKYMNLRFLHYCPQMEFPHSDGNKGFCCCFDECDYTVAQSWEIWPQEKVGVFGRWTFDEETELEPDTGKLCRGETHGSTPRGPIIWWQGYDDALEDLLTEFVTRSGTRDQCWKDRK